MGVAPAASESKFQVCAPGLAAGDVAADPDPDAVVVGMAMGSVLDSAGDEGGVASVDAGAPLQPNAIIEQENQTTPARPGEGLRAIMTSALARWDSLA